jgi:hypothetical protein
MTEAQIKEKISQHFISILANRMGLNVTSPFTDYGVDAIISQVETYFSKEHVRYVESGRFIELQLKCTTESQISFRGGYLNFDLPVKNYNDLIWRRDNRHFSDKTLAPLFLILVVLPDTPELWAFLGYQPERLVVTAKSFWYLPDQDLGMSRKRFTQRIKIPAGNHADFDFFKTIFNLLFKI